MNVNNKPITKQTNKCKCHTFQTVNTFSIHCTSAGLVVYECFGCNTTTCNTLGLLLNILIYFYTTRFVVYALLAHIIPFSSITYFYIIGCTQYPALLNTSTSPFTVPNSHAFLFFFDPTTYVFFPKFRHLVPPSCLLATNILHSTNQH